MDEDLEIGEDLGAILDPRTEGYLYTGFTIFVMELPDYLIGMPEEDVINGQKEPVHMAGVELYQATEDRARRTAADFASVPGCVTIHRSVAPFSATVLAFGMGVRLAVREHRGLIMVGDPKCIPSDTPREDVIEHVIPGGEFVGVSVWELKSPLITVRSRAR